MFDDWRGPIGSGLMVLVREGVGPQRGGFQAIDRVSVLSAVYVHGEMCIGTMDDVAWTVVEELQGLPY